MTSYRTDTSKIVERADGMRTAFEHGVFETYVVLVRVSIGIGALLSVRPSIHRFLQCSACCTQPSPCVTGKLFRKELGCDN